MNKKHTSLALSVALAVTSLFPTKAAEASKGDTSSAKAKTTVTTTSQTKKLQQNLTQARTEYDALHKKFQAERAELLTAEKDYLGKEEGNIDHPYLDCNGLIHTGVGININDKDTFLSLPFRKSDKNETLLTDKEKEDYYKKLIALAPEQKGLPQGQKHSADYYKPFAPYTLAHVTGADKKTENERLLDKKIDEAILRLEAKYGATGFNSLPKSIRLALIDLVFHRGPGAVEEYGKLFAAYQKNDFDEMKKQITVKTNGSAGIKKRNEHRQALIEQGKKEGRSKTPFQLSVAEAKLNYFRGQAGQKPIQSAFSTGNPIKTNSQAQNATTQKAKTQKLASARGR